jgi:hypothetical protein
MSEIDWGKAPEGATHYWPSHGSFYTKIGDEFYFAENIEAGRVNSPASWVESLIPRPSTPWSGEGLPPVGVVCEWEHEANKGAWHKAEIKYTGSAYVIVADFAGIEQHYYLRSMKFRPIRTPEQIAADEREAAIKEMLEDAGRPDTSKTRDQAQLLYDAGWIKQPKP